MSSKKTKVLYVVGSAHSGSTLLQSILGQLDGFCAVGELSALWTKTLGKNLHCGCGVPFRECDFWRRSLDKAYGGLDQIDVSRMVRFSQLVRGRYWLLLFLPGGGRLLASLLGDLPAYMERLYGGIQEATDCKVIVDESKSPVYAHVLSKMPAIDLYLVHLIRDPRGVTYSYFKRERRNAFSTSLYWNIVNSASEVLRRRAPERYLRLRYEDFVQHPKQAVEQMLSLVQETADGLPFEGPHAVHLDATHTVCGNKNRFRTGVVELVLDEAWCSRLSRLSKAIVTALTAPRLLRYGYLGRARG